MHDKVRVIYNFLRYRSKMDKNLFNKTFQGEINDTDKTLVMRFSRLVLDPGQS